MSKVIFFTDKLRTETPMSISGPLNNEALSEENFDCLRSKEEKPLQLTGLDELQVKQFLKETKISSSVPMSIPLIVPENFGIVYPNIMYRSSCPNLMNFPFLESLSIRTIVSLRQDEYTQEELEYMKKRNIAYYHVGMPGSKYRKQEFKTDGEQSDYMDIDSLVRKSLRVILKKESWPVLIHCSGGKHRTGIVIGSLRALMDWPVQERIEEYVCHSHPKEREVDKEYIRNFAADSTLVTLANDLKKYTQTVNED
ncbi:phosphoprotein phosphatase [Schizosaccharomyces cryophilus OY26]|uniref:Phosphoprotein phosphatase n=1 Tax=Schizosaccharomyces cryophilus (strain OY26 / ATCC MYA-4695 / CBS 11777 / NBRC 106824 / NRRL Y48691) TaxID=653667 RepID=S9VMQ6_SCHCR|nr:phosphoprotein phosphatase, variant [Schizosaccharomyces cryophilus OY26]XP_013025924.1 phosphoprotein phosphatase [Schizosaccharomyces cryophilus OY26]EPY49253.1 phosphoprotein phosphatase, variant [Schizosaccharomyces cryophilus OY26]EPY49254.1 phosphoprotein phosphatase [Schizosaccharomyces cryophilus OY26]